MKHLHHIILLFVILLVSCKQEVYHNVTINVEPPEGGSIVMNPSAGQVLEGTSVTFTAQPKGGFVFTGWSGDLSGTDDSKTITVTSDLTVTANFSLKEYPLTVTTEGEGTISERVISTKTDYALGTVVELTATAADHWLFDHWEGDASGEDNLIQITVSGEKSVTAVFSKSKYAFNISIVGPGVVNEYFIEKEPCTIIKLEAIPDMRAFNNDFLGWSGDLSGNQRSITISLEKDMEITATFGRVAKQYPQPDLKAPWVSQKRLYSEIDFRGLTNDPADLLPVDYNNDGYVDVIATVTEDMLSLDNDCPIRFYLGGPDGSFSPDPIMIGN